MMPSCNPEPLVMSEACEVQLCPDCGIIHFSIGPVSLRFRERHFEEIANNLRQALFELQKIRNPDAFGSDNSEKITRLHS